MVELAGIFGLCIEQKKVSVRDGKEGAGVA